MLKIGATGPDVVKWQTFLVGQSLLEDADGSFGPETEAATVRFQQASGLDGDGAVGDLTLAAAGTLGYDQFDQEPRVVRVKAVSYADKQSAFGPLAFVPASLPGNPEAIKITNNWAKNLKKVSIPQLAGIGGAPKDCAVLFHSKGADKLAALWARWEADGLLPLIKTWDGAWAPRFIRGSKSVLSSHAFATAFDINARWNPLGVLPPSSDKPGSVRDLVGAANELGFFWGGDFPGRPDGMHFELGAEE